MKKYEWSGLVLGVLLTFSVACKAVGPEGAETPHPESVSTATANPSRTPRPTATATSLAPGTATPEQSATATATIVSTDSWLTVGSKEVGFELSVPADWVRMNDVAEWFGSRALVLADSAATGARLHNKTAVGEGVFVVAFIPEPGTPLAVEANSGVEPTTVLTEWLSSQRVGTTGEIKSLTINGNQGATAGLHGDPTALLGAAAEGIQIQLLLLIEPQYNRPTLFLIGGEDTRPILEVDSITGKISNSIVLHQTPLPGIAGNLGNGSLLAHTLQAGHTDTWLFNGESGRYATIAVRTDVDMDLVLSLVSPSGVTLAHVDRGYSGDSEAIFDLLLPETGTYEIIVGDFFTYGGRYTISLTQTDTAQYGGGGQIQLRQTVTGELRGGQDDVWLFSGTAGDIISIVLTPSTSRLDVFFELRAPDGERLIALDESYSGDPEILSGFELPVTGEYRLIVNSFNASRGEYTLALDEGAETANNFYDAGDLVYGDGRSESLQAHEVHAWFFEGQAGHEVIVTVTPLNNGLDMDIWLLDPNLQRLAMQDENLFGMAETIELTLPANGEYVLIVREYYGTAGDYTIDLDSSNYYLSSATLSFNELVTGTLTAGYADTWTLSGRAGEVVAVTLQPMGQNDLSFWLIDPNGERVKMIDRQRGAGVEQLSFFTLTATGDWLLVVRDVAGAAGVYALTAERQE